MALTTIDYILLAILAVSGLVGLLRGLVKEALSLVIWAAALWCAARFGWRAAPFLDHYLADAVLRLWAGRLLVLVAVLFAGSLINWLVGYLIRNSPVTGPDRILGMLFGIGRGVLLVALIVLALQLGGFAAEPWWRQSKLIPYAVTVSEAIRDAAEHQFGIRLGSHGDPGTPDGFRVV